ncbi:hypothetical protein JD969_15900 [Planctomycetota bacterium]|nr:hypothetical protein JD969_15900 [Planctomycetota bacterium]
MSVKMGWRVEASAERGSADKGELLHCSVSLVGDISQKYIVGCRLVMGY